MGITIQQGGLSASDVIAWTPGLSFGGGSTGMTFGTQRGVYVKIGRLVTFNGRIVLTAKGSSTGVANLTGLPISASGNADFGVVFSYWASMASLVDGMRGNISATVAELYNGNAATTPTLTHANFTETTTIVFNGQYFSA